MKKLCLLFLLILCFAGLGFAHVVPKKLIPSEKLMVYAEEFQEEQENIQISISGHASKKLNADMAIIFACFESESDQYASNKNMAYDLMIENLFENGVKDEDVFLYNFEAFPKYNNEGKKKYLNCYSFNIMVRDMQNLDKILSVLNFCNVRVNDIKYQLSNINEEYTNILNDAVEDAKHRAGEVFKKDDFQLVDVKEKSVLYSSTLSDLDNDQVVIEIQAKVEVVFE